MEKGEYPVRLFRFDDDWICEYPDLPGCSGVGETIEEALRDGEAAKELWLEVYRDENDAEPEVSDQYYKEYSGKWNLRVPKSLHRELTIKANEEGVSLNTLCIYLLTEGLQYKMTNISHNTTIANADRNDEEHSYPSCRNSSNYRAAQ